MQKGLDRIGLGGVEWRKFFGWFEQWVPHAVMFLLGVVVVTYTDDSPAYWSGCFVTAIGITGVIKNLAGPWVRRSAAEKATEEARTMAAGHAALAEGMMADTGSESAKPKKEIPDY